MNACRKTLLLGLCIGAVNPAFADVLDGLNHPISVRQDYGEGEYTEMHCGWSRDSAKNCRFVIGEQGARREYKFSPQKIGYSRPMHDYDYYHFSGSDQFGVLVRVRCSAKDLAAIRSSEDPPRPWKCVIHFEPEGDRLAARFVSIYFDDQIEHRSLGP